MSSVFPAEDIIRDRAAYWAARLNDSDVTDVERAELHDWLLADTRHANEFRAHNALVGLAHDFPGDLRARLRGYVPTYRERSAQMSRHRWGSLIAVAATVLIAVAAFWLTNRETFATDTGEFRTVHFEDGSIAHLNTRSWIQWLGDERERRVDMRAGEVLFDVRKDPSRPFRVVLDNSVIEVVGTRFNVYRKTNGDVIVTVLEGEVSVRELSKGANRPIWERRLGANQGIVYRADAIVNDVHETLAGKATNWRKGVLVMEKQPLDDVLAELSRYTDQPIVLSDQYISGVRVGGVVTVRDVRVAFARLEKLAPVHVVEHDGKFTVTYQAENRTE